MLELTDWAAALVRVAAGVILLVHGIKHARGRVKTTAWFGSIGFRSPGLQWLASTVSEIGVGAFLIAGLASSFAAAGLIAVMAVAFWTVHRAAGFWVTARPDEGWEYVFVLATIGVFVAVGGPGALSIDAVLGIDEVLDGWIGVGVAAGAVLAAAAQLAVFYRPRETTGP